jgi:hypothetical protein
MKIIYFFSFILLLLISETSSSQVAINSNGAPANSSAMLDITSTNKGILIPRVADTSSVSTPAVGLLIYRTNLPQGFYYYNGQKWQKIGVEGSSGSGSSGATNYVDLTTNQTVNGQKIWNGNATFNSGINISGGTINLNNNSNSTTNINSGTSNGTVNIANGTLGGNAVNIGNSIGATSLNLRTGTSNFTLDGVGSSNYFIGASTTTGTINIGGSTQTGAIVIGGGTGTQTLNFGTGGTGIKNINIGTGAVANTIVIGNISPNTSTGINIASPTAQLHIGAGYATANNGAPLKFTAGTNLTTPENGAVEYDGTNYFVTSGSTRYTLAKTLTTTASLNFGTTVTNTSSDLTVTVTGAALNDVVLLGVPNSAVNNNSSFSAWVSAANTVKVRFNNYSSASINPGVGTFRITVLKY